MSNRTIEPGSQAGRALAKANRIRVARSVLRHALARGEIAAAQLLRDVPDEAGSWMIYDVLSAQRHWGTQRTRRLLRRCQVPESKPLGELTDRQREQIIRALEPRDSTNEGGL